MRPCLAALAAILLPATLLAQSGPDLLVTAEWLKAHRADAGLVLVQLAPAYDTTGAALFIPGSSSLAYGAIAIDRDGIQAELPDPAQLAAVLSSAGISNDSHVIVYSADPITAARAFVTLETAGVAHVALLDGGPAAWVAAGGTLQSKADGPKRPGRFVPAARRPVIVDAAWMQGKLAQPAGVAFIDTRTVGEYDGTGARRGLPSKGHLAGAQLLLWQDLLRGGDDRRFKPRAELAALYAARGAEPGDTVVSYCYLGYRASISYFVARYLGYDAHIYDGSYDDWSRRNLPLVTGSAPR